MASEDMIVNEDLLGSGELGSEDDQIPVGRSFDDTGGDGGTTTKGGYPCKAAEDDPASDDPPEIKPGLTTKAGSDGNDAEG